MKKWYKLYNVEFKITREVEATSEDEAADEAL